MGCVIGIGLYKGVRNINFKVLGEIGIGWISTPLMSGTLAFLLLFFVKNMFNINVGHKIDAAESFTGHTMTNGQDYSGIIKYLLIGIVAAGVIAMIYYYLLERKKNREISKSEEKFWKYLK